MIHDPAWDEDSVIVECDGCGYKERYSIFADHLDADEWDSDRLYGELDMNGWVQGDTEKEFCMDCAEALGMK